SRRTAALGYPEPHAGPRHAFVPLPQARTPKLAAPPCLGEPGTPLLPHLCRIARAARRGLLCADVRGGPAGGLAGEGLRRNATVPDPDLAACAAGRGRPRGGQGTRK